MPLVEVTVIEGRSKEQKVKMMEKVTDAIVETLDAPIATVRVVIREVPAEHWAVGGKPKG